MCGIFGYVGINKNVSQMILDGLKLLEYRGYDSWGVAIKQSNELIFIEKHTGKIGSAKLPKIMSSIGIGHTRWATHGGVTDANAHPHTDCKGEIAVVHNGIVENFEVLKKNLIKKGHIFKSETDTEILAHQIEELRKTDRDMKSVMSTLGDLITGMNAVIAFVLADNAFYVIKNGSPLVIGKGIGESYIASDATAISEHTKKVYFLEDGEMAVINKVGVLIFGIDNKLKDSKFTTLDYDQKATKKGDYDHFMIKEIEEQPKVIQNIIETQHDAIKIAADKIKAAFGTYLVGCGTASYACLAGTYLFSKIAHHHVNFSIGSEFGYLLDFLKEDSLVFALSQSGETIDIISSIKKAKEKNSQILSLTNVAGSTLYRMSDHALLLQAGPEKAVASTKAYIAKITFLYLIANLLSDNYDKGSTHLYNAITEVKNLIDNKSKIKKLAEAISNKRAIFILGRGVSYAAALEAALKIKEVSYIHAEGFAAGELKHGVIALIEKGTPVILFNPDDETYEDTLSAAHEVSARGAYVIGVSNKNSEVYDNFIEVKNCDDATIIPNVVVAQLLGYYLALAKGCDPDMPRNLAKSVTVK